MECHKVKVLSYLRKILENWNHIKHLFWPQCYEIRNELQGKKRKKHKHTEAKQYVTK